jgi:hypothetical protein
LTPCGFRLYAQVGVSLMFRIGESPAASAFSRIESSGPHEYPGELGSLATKPSGRVEGAIERQWAVIRTKVAPAARVRSKAVAPCGPSKSTGSTTAVASGAVPGVV